MLYRSDRRGRAGAFRTLVLGGLMALIASLGVGLTGCEEEQGPMEETGEQIDEGADEAEDAADDATDN